MVLLKIFGGPLSVATFISAALATLSLPFNSSTILVSFQNTHLILSSLTMTTSPTLIQDA